eukprot:TRINITY_DN2451_c0_g1_i10.p1 TRINITY_DN2451_c0_g1~~TRINITY_DN2451_c0_g1_i10.p1  ORF type:complete len:468 (-),score=156.94 TRINITY_DN2451_c0_g1_i10:465-1868(-)
MLSPFASIKKMTPFIKARADAHSVLCKIAARKDIPQQSAAKPNISNNLVEQVVISPDADGSLAAPVNFAKSKHIPFIDKTGLADMPTSPLINLEGIRSNLRRKPSQSPRSNFAQSKDIIICSCGNEHKEENNGMCPECMKKLQTPSIEGYLYEKTDPKTLNRFWYTLIGNHIYRYNSKNDTESNGMYSLAGSYVKQELADIVQKKLPLYPLRIYFGPSQWTLFAIKKEESDRWAKALKDAIGYSNLSDYYELGAPLGRGKFGIVRLATHKQSGTKVAVKVIKKAKLTVEDLDLAKREIEILKVCQHPNIIQLFDSFENPEYIYIVIELLPGGDLYEYLDKRNFRVSENRARDITHSLATALYYLHSYGIVHRDIKLDNILMTDNSDQSEAKLVDFGLSKMIGPKESCTEPFGTFGYAAPEVLRGKPYDKAIDIWSLGVVLYILLTGRAPFEEGSEKRIALYTCHLSF